jgi:hypothetical protein
VNGYPTIKYFGNNKERPEDYNGGRSEADIVDFATAKWQDQLPPPQVSVGARPTNVQCVSTLHDRTPAV